MRLMNDLAWRELLESAHGDWFPLKCIRFAETWAETMENLLVTNPCFGECALLAYGETVLIHQLRGSVMAEVVGNAVRALNDCWEHGAQLRQWYDGMATRRENHHA